MERKEKMEFCKDILRIWHIVRSHGLFCILYINSPFAELNTMGAFMGCACGDAYLKILWQKIESFWRVNRETQEDMRWKKEVLVIAYHGIYMMEPIDEFIGKLNPFLEADGETLTEWNHRLCDEIGDMKENDHEAFCDYDVFSRRIGLPMREEENTLFDEILALESVITELFESETMREYLHDNMGSLSRWKIISMICCAAVSLERKWELLMKLADVENFGEWKMDYPDDWETDESYRLYAKAAEVILEGLKLKENEIYIVEQCWYDEEIKDEGCRTLGPAASYEKALDMISAADNDEDSMDEWFRLYKWEKDAEGNYVDKSYYICAGGEVMYCSWDEDLQEGLSERHFDAFAPYEELNLPTPFQLGDIVKIDCRPFAPSHNVLILENRWPEDCCSLQGLYAEDDGYFSSGAIKHKHIFPEHYYPYGSPLYRIEHVSDFTEKDEMLLKARESIGGDLKKSDQLQKWIHDRRD